MAIAPFRPRIADFVAWSLLALALLFAIYVRVRLREFPLERDEGEFAYAGQLILQGVPPYKLAYNMKLPGTYLSYAALMAVFGQTTAGIHMGLLAVNLATIVLLFCFVRRLFDPFSAGMAAVAYAIFSVSPAVLGMAAHATHFVALFGLAGSYVLWRHLQSGRAWQAFVSGLLMGIAFLMKQQGIFLMVFGGAILLLQLKPEAQARPPKTGPRRPASGYPVGLQSRLTAGSIAAYPRKRLPAALGLYWLAAVLPYGLICLWLWRAGVWEKFWFWTVDYASKYVQNIPLSMAATNLWLSGSGIAWANRPLLLLALVGIAAVATPGRSKPGVPSFVFAFLVFSVLCVCPGLYFRRHYFIVMLPAVAMLIGIGSRLLWDLACGRLGAGRLYCPRSHLRRFARWPLKPEAQARSGLPWPRLRVGLQSRLTAGRLAQSATAAKRSRLPAALAALLIVAEVVATVWIEREFFFTLDPLEACRLTYMSHPFLECPRIAAYLEARTAADDTIAVLGSEPEIYFDAQRRSATGYIYTYGLTEDQPLAAKMQKEMIAEIESAKPAYIILMNVRRSWLGSSLAEAESATEIFQWAGDYLEKNYQIAGILEPRSPLETACFWDDQVAKYHPPSKPSALDFDWKLVNLPNIPSLQRYSPLPYIMVFRRK